MFKSYYIMVLLLAIVLSISNTVFAADSEFVLDGDTSSSSFSVKKANKETVARFSGDGRVGIGTNNPQEKFDITSDNTTGYVGTRLQIPDNSTIDLRTYGDSSSAWTGSGILTTWNTDVDLGLVADSKTNVDSGTSNHVIWLKATTGNVGIGTSEPETRLEVQDSANVFIQAESTSNHAGSYYKNSDGFWGLFVQPASGNFFIKDENARLDVVLIEKTSGNVGIGTTAPTERLDVVGNIKASGAISQGSSREFKDNIASLSTEQAMMAIKGLIPVTFTYKSDNSGEEHLGFIAEDVPTLVASQDRKHLSSMDLTAVLAKVIQEQQRILHEQQEKMKGIMKKMQILESTVQNYVNEL